MCVGVGGGRWGTSLVFPALIDPHALTTLSVSILCQGVLMDFFRIRWKHGFDVPSMSGKSLLNNGNRLFLASGVDWSGDREGNCVACVLLIIV